MRRILRKHFLLDTPEAHARGGQFLFAMVAGLASAGLWGWITGEPLVSLMTLTTTLIHAWFTPAARETRVRRLAIAFLHGAVWSICGQLAMGKKLMG
jgi:hypothetical protein